MQALATTIDVVSQADDINRLYDESMEIVTHYSIEHMHFEFETINPKQYRLVHLDMPRVGEWDQIFVQVLGDILSYNQYLKLYPTFIKNQSATKRVIFPSNTYINKFKYDTSRMDAVIEWPTVEDTSMYQERTVIYTPILLKIMQSIHGMLTNLHQLHNQYNRIHLVK